MTTGTTTPSRGRVLGRGLSSLLDDLAEDRVSEPRVVGQTTVLPIDSIAPSSNQPRRSFNEDELNELASSIREKGILQPILVRPVQGGLTGYEIVAGERRWRAAQKARLHEVPVLIRELDDKDALEIAMIENVQRVDLNAIEEAMGYAALIERFSYTHEALSRAVGKSRPHITNMLRLVDLPEPVKELVRSGEISAGHARAVIGTSDPISLARVCAERGLSVREVERMARRSAELGEEATRPARTQQKDANTLLLEGDLGAVLRAPVSIRLIGAESGEIRIGFRSLDELDDLCRRLCGEPTES